MTKRKKACAAIDANALGFKRLQQCVGHVSSAAEHLSHEDMDVHVFCDNEMNRHFSKLDHYKRCVDRDKLYLKLIELRSEMARICREGGETKETAEKIQQTEKTLRNKLPISFVSDLKESLRRSDALGVTVTVAPYQADPCIAREALDADIDLILTTDSDFQMFIGPGKDGLSDISVRDIHVDLRTSKITSCKIVTGQESAALFIQKTIGERVGCNVLL